MSCTAAHAASPDLPILVVDASADGATEDACERLKRRHGQALKLTHRYARQAGLARQRNEAIDICRGLGCRLIHFIDDDTEVASGYFTAIESRFRRDPSVMGVGGVIVNQPRVTFLTLKRVFMLASRRRSSVLRSGRNMLGQYPGTSASDRVEWLNGCSMSYRSSAFSELRFDGRLEGASLGEDYDFSFRLSRRHKLAVEPSAECVHHLAPSSRYSRREHARQRTQIIHRRVCEWRHLGLSRAAFWWSVFGDLMLRGGYGVVRADGESLEEALGVAAGVAGIVHHRRRRKMRPGAVLPTAGDEA